MEGAEDGIAFSSGMAAISNVLFALLRPGDRVVSIKDSYGGTSICFELDVRANPIGVKRETCTAVEKRIRLV